MAEEVRLRFGFLDPEEDDPPTTNDLENRLEKQQTQLSTPNSRPERIFTDLTDGYFFEFATEVESEYQTLGEDGIEDHTLEEAYSARVLYFDDGGFIFESREDIPDERIPAFLLSKSPEDAENDYNIFQDFKQEHIRQEYRDANEVSRIRFGELGNLSSGDHDLSGLISELGEEVGLFQLSCGHSPSRDLKRSDLIDKFVELSTIRQLTYYNSEGVRLGITGSGRLVFQIPKDNVESEISELREKAQPFLQQLLEDYSSANE
jgi:hypothetical protein